MKRALCGKSEKSWVAKESWHRARCTATAARINESFSVLRGGESEPSGVREKMLCGGKGGRWQSTHITAARLHRCRKVHACIGSTEGCRQVWLCLDSMICNSTLTPPLSYTGCTHRSLQDIHTFLHMPTRRASKSVDRCVTAFSPVDGLHWGAGFRRFFSEDWSRGQDRTDPGFQCKGEKIFKGTDKPWAVSLWRRTKENPRLF